MLSENSSIHSKADMAKFVLRLVSNVSITIGESELMLLENWADGKAKRGFGACELRFVEGDTSFHLEVRLSSVTVTEQYESFRWGVTFGFAGIGAGMSRVAAFFAIGNELLPLAQRIHRYAEQLQLSVIIDEF